MSIVWYKVLPPKYGGQKGIAYFNQQLGKTVPLTCICSYENKTEESLSYNLKPVLPKSRWQFFNPLIWKKIINISKEINPSHIILEHPYHAIAALRAKKKIKAKLIVHAHNIEHLRFKEQNKWWWRLVKYLESKAFQHADIIIFKTETDLQQAIQIFNLKNEACILLPYGINTIAEKINKKSAKELIQKRHGLYKEQMILFFAGTLDYLPNAKAVENIYKEIAPRLLEKKFDGKIIICGRNKGSQFQYLNKLKHPLVLNAGEVDDIETYFAATDVFINPVLQGGGIQTKNIEAISYGCQLVCFENMLSGINKNLFTIHITTAQPGNFEQFCNATRASLQKDTSPPTAEFYNQYCIENLTKKLVERLITD